MLLLLIPPVVKPSEPLVGVYSLARLAREQGIACTVMDCSLEWVHHRIWERFSRAGEPLRATASRHAKTARSPAELPAIDPRASPEPTAVGALSPWGEGGPRPEGQPDIPAGAGGPVGTRLQRALGRVGRGNPLIRSETYENADRYRQAVEQLEVVLRHEKESLVAGGVSYDGGAWPRKGVGLGSVGEPHDSTGPDDAPIPLQGSCRDAGRCLDQIPGLVNPLDEVPGLANFEVRGLRAVSRSDLLSYAGRQATVFDDYLEGRLLPEIARLRPDTIGFSLTFLHQAFATIRFAAKVRERFPRTRLVLGGPMAACWQDADWGRPPLDLFDAVFSACPGLPAAATGSRVFPLVPPAGQAFYPDPRDLPGQDFFAPRPVMPMAFGLGCSWGRCTFCPDYQTGGGLPADWMRSVLPDQMSMTPADQTRGLPADERRGRRADGPRGWLEGIEAWLAARGPLVIHLTDSCADPRHLDRLAHAVSERQWPVRWYAFVRFTDLLAEPGRLERWAKGGCGLLEFGLETAAEELLRKMNKGISIHRAAEILQRSAGAGIRNYVYLLFGFPGETAGHQGETLEFVLRHQDAIHYLNNAILNLPRCSPLGRSPRQFGIEALTPFPGEDGDLSLYTDFSDGLGSARQRARRFLHETFLADPAVRSRGKAVPPVFKSNHAIFSMW
jgi:hypothetical protein